MIALMFTLSVLLRKSRDFPETTTRKEATCVLAADLGTLSSRSLKQQAYIVVNRGRCRANVDALCG